MRSSIKSQVEYALFIAIAFSTLPFAAYGQAALEEVLVTATRRGETNIMETPVAITALSGRDISNLNARDLNDIGVAVPGLSAATVSAFKSASFGLRGVSETTIILYKESPVAVLLDDFVMPHIQTSNLEMFDIESIEVLRGPQGTLFGKNTTGGVIRVQTKKPVLDERGADLTFSYGEFDTKKGTAAFNFGLSDTLAFRFAGMYLHSDGYYKNTAAFGPLGADARFPVDPAFAGQTGTGDGRDLGGEDVFSGRFKVLWEPLDNLSFLAQYEMIRDNGDTPPIVQESPASYLLPRWGYPAATGDPLKNAGVFHRDSLLVNTSDGHQVDVDGFYLHAEWGIGDYTLHGMMGYRAQESRLPNTYTGTTGGQSLFDATRDDDRQTWQAEVRFASDLEGSYNYVIGGFYQNDETKFCVLQIVGFLDNFFLPNTPQSFFNNNPLILCNQQDAEAFAVFADATVDFTERLHITSGIRYSYEAKHWTGRPRIPTSALDGAPTLTELGEPINGTDWGRFPGLVVRDDEIFQEPTFRAVVQYDLTDDINGYVSYSRGFKSGGYNDQIGTQLNPITPAAARPVLPETANSFEGGMRAVLLDGSMNLSLTAFLVQYKDAQRTLNATFPTGQETLFFNAAELEIRGFEWEGSWAMTDALTVRINGSWNDAEFKSFEADTNFDGVIDTDLSGRPPTRVPEWMFSADATYRHVLGDMGNLDLYFRVSYEDDSVQSYGDGGDRFNTILQEKTLVDASLTWTTPDDKYYVKVFGKNLTDERYRTGSLSVATIWVMSAYGPPRWFGAEVGANFDL